MTIGFQLWILNVDNEMEKTNFSWKNISMMREILVAFGTGASLRAESPSIFQEN